MKSVFLTSITFLFTLLPILTDAQENYVELTYEPSISTRAGAEKIIFTKPPSEVYYEPKFSHNIGLDYTRIFKGKKIGFRTGLYHLDNGYDEVRYFITSQPFSSTFTYYYDYVTVPLGFIYKEDNFFINLGTGIHFLYNGYFTDSNGESVNIEVEKAVNLNFRTELGAYIPVSDNLKIKLGLMGRYLINGLGNLQVGLSTGISYKLN